MSAYFLLCKNMFNLFKVIIQLHKITSLKGKILPQCILFMSQTMENFHLSKLASERLRLIPVAWIPVHLQCSEKALVPFCKGDWITFIRQPCPFLTHSTALTDTGLVYRYTVHWSVTFQAFKQIRSLLHLLNWFLQSYQL